LVWFGLIWSGLVWFGLVWLGWVGLVTLIRLGLTGLVDWVISWLQCIR
jgi:hypothetical protein